MTPSSAQSPPSFPASIDIETIGEDLPLLEGIRTTRAIRRLRPDPVPPELIRKVAGMFADATRKRLARSKGKQDGQGYGGVIIMWGIGYNQHIHGQHNTISIINLLTMTGNLAKPGCGPFSMTGQPNAMGARMEKRVMNTMMCSTTVLWNESIAAWRSITADTIGSSLSFA